MYDFPILQLYRFIRISKPVTKICGRLYHLDRYKIEIVVTFKCNLGCFNCSLSCRQAVSDECMSLNQVEKFIDESVKQGRKWKVIRILGGEPCLHPHIFDIIQQLLMYKKNFSPDATIELATNGFGDMVNDILSRISTEVVIVNTAKESQVHLFEAFNMAPKDCRMYKYVDYSNGCWVIKKHGIGLTHYGYYPCAVGGGIDRVLGFNVGRKSLPMSDDLMIKELKIICKYCGFFKGYVKKDWVTEEKISSSWKQAYENYKRKKPCLSLY